MRLAFAAALAVAACLSLAACSTVRPVEVRTAPSGADVFVDGERVGTSPVVHGFDFDDPDAVYEVVAQKEGYIPNRKRVSELYLDIALEDREARDEDEGPEYVLIPIDEDEAWTHTAPSEAANRWVELEVDPVLDQSQVWEILVDALTAYYPELANQDHEAGYIASVPKLRRFDRGPTASVAVKNQFFCSITSRTPLVYKVTIASRIDEGQGWQDYPRVFKRDAPLFEDLQRRLVGGTP